MSKLVASVTISTLMIIANLSTASGGQYIFHAPPLVPGLMICTQDKVTYYGTSGTEGTSAVTCGDAPQDGHDVSKTIPPVAYIFEKEIYDGLQTKKSTDEMFKQFTQELQKIKSDLRTELKEELLKELRPKPGIKAQDKGRREPSTGSTRK